MHVALGKFTIWLEVCSFKAFLCGCSNPVTLGNVVASYCKFTFAGDIFAQFVMASNVKMEVFCVFYILKIVGNASKTNENTLE